MSNRGLIQIDKYFVMFGQLRSMGRTVFGDLTETSAQTISCLVYHEQAGENQTVPGIGKVIDHFACIPSSVTVADGDHLTDVRFKRNNEQFLADSRVVKISKYGDWRHGSRFVKLDLDLDLA